MVPTLTGLIVIALGVWCQFGDYRRILLSLMVLTLFEASNAADLVALGGSSVTPSKLFLAFFVLRLVSMHNGFSALAAELSPRRVLFLYLVLLIWVVCSAVLLPRLFEEMTQVFSLARSDIDIGAIPLHPSSGNITQAVYAIGSFVIALGVCVLARKQGACATILTGFLVITGLDIFLALADLATSATHTEFLMDAIHTGAYTFLTSDESGGLKRISGSFSEASAFATFSLELLAINFSLFLSRVRPRLTAGYSLVLAVLLFLSTSSTAYVGLAVLGAAFAVSAVWALLAHGSARPLKILAASAAVGLFVGCLAFLVVPSLTMAVWNLLDVSLFQKGQTESALERGELNTQAAQIFFDTYGLGAGVGSTRASNFILVLASNLGVIGVVLFAALMLALAFLRPRADLGADDRSIIRAARVGMLASLVPATLIGTIFDLGPLFYILVGIVASSAEKSRDESVAKVPGKLSAEPVTARHLPSVYWR